MALKGDRHELMVDLHYFCNTSGNRGGVMSIVTSGSGNTMDQSVAVVGYAALASGSLPIGLCLQDVVSIDQTRQHINFHRDEVQVGSKVALLREGYVVTDQVVSGTSPTAGNIAYLGPAGQVTPTSTGYIFPNAASPAVGKFLSTKDADGYVTLAVKL
jgi:hypothetical protein